MSVSPSNRQASDGKAKSSSLLNASGERLVPTQPRQRRFAVLMMKTRWLPPNPVQPSRRQRTKTECLSSTMVYATRRRGFHPKRKIDPRVHPNISLRCREIRLNASLGTGMGCSATTRTKTFVGPGFVDDIPDIATAVSPLDDALRRRSRAEQLLRRPAARPNGSGNYRVGEPPARSCGALSHTLKE